MTLGQPYFTSQTVSMHLHSWTPILQPACMDSCSLAYLDYVLTHKSFPELIPKFWISDKKGSGCLDASVGWDLLVKNFLPGFSCSTQVSKTLMFTWNCTSVSRCTIFSQIHPRLLKAWKVCKMWSIQVQASMLPKPHFLTHSCHGDQACSPVKFLERAES